MGIWGTLHPTPKTMRQRKKQSSLLSPRHTRGKRGCHLEQRPFGKAGSEEVMSKALQRMGGEGLLIFTRLSRKMFENEGSQSMSSRV